MASIIENQKPTTEARRHGENRIGGSKGGNQLLIAKRCFSPRLPRRGLAKGLIPNEKTGSAGELMKKGLLLPFVFLRGLCGLRFTFAIRVHSR
jgi:hypothetical protein